MFPLKLRTISTTYFYLINTVQEFLATDGREGRKDLPVEKEEIKASPFADDTIISE